MAPLDRLMNKIRQARKKKNGKRGPMRSRASNILAQGVGGVTQRAFGSSSGGLHGCWDATLPPHLPLPRAVGPYTVIRTTKRISSARHFHVFGTFQNNNPAISSNGHWSTVCSVADVVSGTGIDQADNAHAIASPMESIGSAATVCPSAFTVQVMNTEALQTTHGMIYAGVVSNQLPIGGRTETWNELGDYLVEFQRPRLLAAAKTALRGVKMDSYPLNMTEVSKFTPLAAATPGAFTYNANKEEPTGWAPIFVYNPDGVELEYLVTTEWRVRFDFTNPASASHIGQGMSTDRTWHQAIARAMSLGNGVLDIADVVANTGKLFNRMRRGGNTMAAIMPQVIDID